MTTPYKTKFQQRHYEAVAEFLQRFDADTDISKTELVRMLADFFAADNRLFDRNRFIVACVPGANVRARRKTVQERYEELMKE